MKYEFEILLNAERCITTERCDFEFEYDGVIKEDDFVWIPDEIIKIEKLRSTGLIYCENIITTSNESINSIFEEFSKDDRRQRDKVKKLDEMLNKIVTQDDICISDYLYAIWITHDIVRNITRFTLSECKSEDIK